MAQHDLYGFGNGIVDILIEVSEEAFAPQNFTKGSMELVSADEQQSLLSTFDSPGARLVSGGSVANSVILFQQLGGKAVFATKLGDDKYGLHYKGEFDQLGIDLGNPLHVGKTTGTSLIMITPDAERTMRTCLAVSGEMDGTEVREEQLDSSDVLFIEGYLLAGSPELISGIESAAKTFRAAGKTVAVTLSAAFIIEHCRESLDRILEHCNLVFANEEEAMALTGAETVEAAFSQLSERFEEVAVTHGPGGAFVKLAGESTHVDAFETDPVDLTGAGDAFAGAFLRARSQHLPPAECGSIACYFSSKVISQVGARLNEISASDFSEAAELVKAKLNS